MRRVTRWQARLAQAIAAPGGRRLALAGIVALALGLRLLRLNFQPLWWDEGWSLYFATSDLGSMLRLTAVDIHPPLYYLLLHLHVALVGASPLAVRLLSVLIGTACVPLLYLAGRRLVEERAGLLAAFLLAISPFAVYYSQEVRMYGLVTLLGLGAFCCALELEPGRWRAGAWVGYVLLAAAALYTQYYAAFLLVGLNLVLALRWLRLRRPFRSWLPWLGAQLAAVALFVPWLWFAGGKLLSYVRYKVGVEQDVPLGLGAYLGRHLAALGWGHAEGALAEWWWLGLLPLGVLLLCGAAVWLWRRAVREGADGRLGSAAAAGALVTAVLLACGYAVNRLYPFDAPRIERQLLLALPYFLLLAAAVLAWLWRRWRPAGAVCLALFLAAALASLGFFYSVPRYPNDDYRPVAARIGVLGGPSDAILAVHPWQVGYFTSYLRSENRPALILAPQEVWPRARQVWADEPQRMEADLEALVAAHGRLWLPAHQAMGRILEDAIAAYLAGNAYPALSEWYGPHTLLLAYAGGQPAAQGATARFGDWLSLEQASLGTGPVEAGWGVVPVALTWRLSARPDAAFTVGLRLADAAGRVWAQRDSEPVAGRLPFTAWPVGQPGVDRHGLLVPAGTPPGEYRVTVRVYRSQDLAVLPAAFAGGGGGEVTLGTVRVLRPKKAPPLEALGPGLRLLADWGPLRLLGFSSPGAAPLLPGESVGLDLFWQTLSDPAQDYLPRLQLFDARGALLTELTEKPVAGAYPTAWWQAGELVRDPHDLPIPAAAPPGRYRLSLSLVRAATGLPVAMEGGRTSLELFEVEVQGRARRFERTAPGHVFEAFFGPRVHLVGYDLPRAEGVGDSALEIALHWHALGTPERNYFTFVHLLNGQGEIVAQHDGVPGEGRLPTRGWLPGEYLIDRHVLPLPPGLPAGEYWLAVGLFDPATGQRLGERVLLDTPVRVTADVE